MKSLTLAPYVSAFLNEHLPIQRNISENTLKSYRDTFVLFLRFCRDVKHWNPDGIKLEALDAALVFEFLESLEKDRHCSVATRNHRLASLHSFFRYVQAEVPELLGQYQRILAIPSPRHPRPPIQYLSQEDMANILAQPDSQTRLGRRDRVLLSLLYDSGARVQEIIDLVARDVRLEAPAQVRLTGKGRKTRIVPLTSNMAELLSGYMREQDLFDRQNAFVLVFPNRFGAKLSRSGIRHILQKYARMAGVLLPGRKRQMSPHVLRHSRAMHLLEAGTPLIVIRDFLGHVDINTTETYARADLEMKRQAMAKVKPCLPGVESRPAKWQGDKRLLEWLRSL
jgi:integrase/recombinase XerD